MAHLHPISFPNQSWDGTLPTFRHRRSSNLTGCNWIDVAGTLLVAIDVRWLPAGAKLQWALMAVNAFSWLPHSSDVTWLNGNDLVRLCYARPIPRALPLLDGSGVAIVEPHEDVGPNNAIVVDANGALRFRIALPRDGRSWFGDIYYIDVELTVIEWRGGTDFAHVVDEQSGRLVRSRESR